MIIGLQGIIKYPDVYTLIGVLHQCQWPIASVGEGQRGERTWKFMLKKRDWSPTPHTSGLEVMSHVLGWGCPFLLLAPVPFEAP